MLEVSLLVETIIYGYFVVVAALGCYLHGRLWIAYRQNRTAKVTDGGQQLDG
ncbi:hypothetical protein [Natronorubrum halophilum]|uniref:hypothetical protein n=1 Tax=Natronorubrum halophilum TaxID=1702106 RepID=UPI0014857FC3|nr:hypothetical protein [Natronorubrum halophilum]